MKRLFRLELETGFHEYDHATHRIDIDESPDLYLRVYRYIPYRRRFKITTGMWWWKKVVQKSETSYRSLQVLLVLRSQFITLEVRED